MVGGWKLGQRRALVAAAAASESARSAPSFLQAALRLAVSLARSLVVVVGLGAAGRVANLLLSIIPGFGEPLNGPSERRAPSTLHTSAREPNPIRAARLASALDRAGS